MKTLISYIAFTLLAVSAASAATLNVNNNPNRPTGHYATIAEAVDAATAGDILLIHASQTAYTGATINKRLEIIGEGYYTRNKERAWITILGAITFGQIVGSSSSGSIIRNCITSISCAANINNITISNNQVQSLIFNGTGLLCENNICNDGGIQWNITGSNCQIRNNLFIGASLFNFIITSNGSPSIVFTNNTLIKSAGWAFNILNSVIVSNNIFYGISPFGMTATTAIQNNTFSKNLTLGTANDAFQGGIGNIVLDNNGNNNNLVNIDPLMTSSTPTTVTPIYNLDFRLRANSPCRNAGTDGTDIGITGGNSPMIYPLSGEPRLGIIKTMTILNPVVPIGGTLRVQLTAKTRN